MVSTMVCVHTILQDNRHEFNMGLLGALPEQGIRSSHVLIGLVLFAAVTWLGWALYAGRLPGLTA